MGASSAAHRRHRRPGDALFAAGDPAHAQGADGITSMAENIKTWLTGTFAKTIAVIAVVIVGFMFFTGRASLGLLVTVIVGIFIVFSAQWIVDTITGGA
jgi:type IV secretion system protein VirB2